jgi:DNA-directed RNA polymerase subunit RPC12/RpoP
VTQIQADEETYADVPFEGALLTCMVCSSVVDAEGWGRNELECPSCETKVVLHLDPRIYAARSIV